MNITRGWLVLLVLLVAVGQVHAQPQIEVIGTTLTIGAKPSTPVGSSVRLDGLATSGGTTVVFTTPAGDLVRRLVGRPDLPAGIAYLDTAQTFSQQNTFTLGLVTPSVRAAASPFVIRNSTNTTDLVIVSDDGVTNMNTIGVGGTAYIVGNVQLAAGNLQFLGTGQRITGAMGGPATQRLSFQSSVANGPAYLQVIPNGTSRESSLNVYNGSDIDNAAYGMLFANGSNVQLASGASGTGASLSLWLTMAGAPRVQLEISGRSVLNGGTQSTWEYQAGTFNGGGRFWRTGNVNGQLHISAGDDAGTTWSSLFHGTQSVGVANGIWLGSGVLDLTPTKSYQTSLGRINQKYLQLHAAELWVESLVAQDTIATIGGRILVGPTTTLTLDIDATRQTLYTKHNNMRAGDIVYAESGGKVEFFHVNSYLGPCSTPGTCEAGHVDDYAFVMSRNIEASTPQGWPAGTALFNTGNTDLSGSFIDLYSLRSVKHHVESGVMNETGPTIVGNVRVGTGYNAWEPRWAIGHLSGLYGMAPGTYGSAFGDAARTWMVMDSTSGLRAYNFGNAQQLIVHPSGYIRIGRPDGAMRNMYMDGTSTVFYEGTTARLVLDPTNIRFLDTGGSYAYTSFGTAGATFGYELAGFGNTHITNTGVMYMRSGTAIRMILDANNGAMTWYDTAPSARQQIRDGAVQFGNVDAGARVQIVPGALQMFADNGKQWFQTDASNGVIMGDWYTVGSAYFQVAPNNHLYMCATGISCPIYMNGNNGNITMGGNLLLSGGGKIESTSNFILGNTEGMRFYRWAGTSAQAARSIVFYDAASNFGGSIGQDVNGSIRLDSRAGGGGNGIRMFIGGYMTGNIEPGLAMTLENFTGWKTLNVVPQMAASVVGDSTAVDFVPLNAGLGGPANTRLGKPGSIWNEFFVNTVYANGTTAGMTTLLVVKNSAGVNCSIYFHGGIMFSSNCQ